MTKTTKTTNRTKEYKADLRDMKWLLDAYLNAIVKWYAGDNVKEFPDEEGRDHHRLALIDMIACVHAIRADRARMPEHRIDELDDDFLTVACEWLISWLDGKPTFVDLDDFSGWAREFVHYPEVKSEIIEVARKYCQKLKS